MEQRIIWLGLADICLDGSLNTFTEAEQMLRGKRVVAAS